MGGDAFEVVLLKLKPGVDVETFRRSAQKTQEYLERQPGYLERQLLHCEESGHWVDMVRWASRQQADVAARAFPNAPETREFEQMLDAKTVSMFHMKPVFLMP